MSSSKKLIKGPFDSLCLVFENLHKHVHLPCSVPSGTRGPSPGIRPPGSTIGHSESHGLLQRSSDQLRPRNGDRITTANPSAWRNSSRIALRVSTPLSRSTPCSRRVSIDDADRLSEFCAGHAGEDALHIFMTGEDNGFLSLVANARKDRKHFAQLRGSRLEFLDRCFIAGAFEKERMLIEPGQLVQKIKLSFRCPHGTEALHQAVTFGNPLSRSLHTRACALCLAGNP